MEPETVSELWPPMTSNRGFSHLAWRCWVPHALSVVAAGFATATAVLLQHHPAAAVLTTMAAEASRRGAAALRKPPEDDAGEQSRPAHGPVRRLPGSRTQS